MPVLHKLEENFQTHLLNGDQKISASITGSSAEQVAERLAVYSNGYRWRLLEALELDYKLLVKLLGEDAFAKLGYDYIDEYPSRHFSIDLFGQHLPKFLADRKPYCNELHLSEFANFIWELNETIDAPNASLLTAQELAAIPQEKWPDMRLVFHPSLALVRCNWNIVATWQALTNEQHVPPAIKLSEPGFIVVWRKEIQPYYCEIDKKEVEFLRALHQDQTFAVACEGLLQWLAEDEVAQYAVNLLLRWINDGMVSSVKF